MRRLLLICFALLALGHRMEAGERRPAMHLTYDRPATYFEEALPVGNGRMGAMVYGHPDRDCLQLTDITLWTGSPVDTLEGGDAYQWIPEIRRALFDEDYARADSLQLRVQGHNSQFFQALATMHITDYAKVGEGQSKAFVHYRRELDLDSALVKVSYERGGVHYAREYFASHPDKVVAVRLTADRKAQINSEVSLTSLTPHTVKAALNGITLMGHAVGDERESIHYCARLVVNTAGGHVEVTDTTLQIVDADEAILYFVNETSFNGFDRHPVREGAPYIENVTDDAWHLVNYTYDELRSRHVADYKTYYDRMQLQLGSDDAMARFANVPTDRQLLDYADKGTKNPYLETLYFQYGRYLLISSSRTPAVPANLQGLWACRLWNPWRANYTVNINLEENYWPAFATGLAEMAAPLDGFVAALAKTGRSTAQHYYGVDEGWCSGHNSDIWAMSNPVGEHNEKPEWANWNMGGAWLVNTLWDRYLYEQDDNYLRLTAYPLMRGAADFCLHWLIDNPRRAGELITAPSTSPENEYVTPEGYHGMTCYGGTADLAIVRELLTNTIAAGRRLGEDIQKYAAALGKLHPYTVGRQGDLNEWYYDWDDFDPKHRHQSHLIGLYPGLHYLQLPTDDAADARGQLSRRAFMSACERTLEQKGDETTGWSTGWRINLWARLGKGEEAYHIYRKLLTYVSPDDYDGADKRHSGGTYPNLFDAHPPFQIDGNFGGTAGICEMLAQSMPDDAADEHSTTTITLMPAMPADWAEGSVRGLRLRGGYELDMTWKDGIVKFARLLNRRGGSVAVTSNGQRQTIKLIPGLWKKIK